MYAQSCPLSYMQLINQRAVSAEADDKKPACHLPMLLPDYYQYRKPDTFQFCNSDFKVHYTKREMHTTVTKSIY